MSEPSAERPPVASPFAALTIADRFLEPTRQRDLTFVFALVILLLLHAGAFISSITLGDPLNGEPMRDDHGQVETSKVITVDIVSAPDANATTKKSQAGEAAAPVPPKPDTPPETPPPKPEQKPSEAKTETTEKSDKPPVQDPIEGFPDELAQPQPKDKQDADKTDQVQAEPAVTPPPAAVVPEILAAAKAGRVTSFRSAVFAKLRATWPPVVFIENGWADVAIEINRDGSLKGVRFIRSSGDKWFNQQVADAIKAAQFPVPPPDAKPDEFLVVTKYSSSSE